MTKCLQCKGEILNCLSRAKFKFCTTSCRLAFHNAKRKYVHGKYQHRTSLRWKRAKVI